MAEQEGRAIMTEAEWFEDDNPQAMVRHLTHEVDSRAFVAAPNPSLQSRYWETPPRCRW